MTEKKRGRGRPKNSGIEDGRYLDLVADKMAADPSIKKTPAISAVVQTEFAPHQWSAAERRLLRKWNKDSARRLEAARERREEQVRDQRSVNYGADFLAISSFLPSIEAIRKIQAMVETPQMKVFQALAAQNRLHDVALGLDKPFRQLIEQQKQWHRMFGLSERLLPEIALALSRRPT